MGKLNAIMKLLDPRVIAEKIDSPHSFARHSYPFDGSMPTSFQDFQKRLQSYYKHHCAAIGIGKFPDEISNHNAMKIVENAFSDRGGIRYAYQNTVTGMDNGMAALHDAIANVLQEQHRTSYIRFVIDTHIDPLDFDQKVAVVRELLETYYIPWSVYDRVSPEELATNHYAILFSLVQHLEWCFSMCVKS